MISTIMKEGDVRNRIGFALGEATQQWRAAIDRRMRPLGLSQATWRTLFHLERRGDGLSQSVLAEWVGVEGATLVRLIDALEDRGLVERRPSPVDRRCKTLHLTPSGRGLLGEIHKAADTVRDDLLAGIGPDDLNRAAEVLQRIAGNAERLKNGKDKTNQP